MSFRKFDHLTSILHEDNNWDTYRDEVDRKLDSNSPFVPFLGVFLTTTAFFQASSDLHGRARSATTLKSAVLERQLTTDMHETYHLLEAITVRERLDKLRENTSTGKRVKGNQWPGCLGKGSSWSICR